MTQKQMTNLLFLETYLLHLKLHLHLVGNAVMGNCPYFLQGKLAPSIERETEREGELLCVEQYNNQKTHSGLRFTTLLYL